MARLEVTFDTSGYEDYTTNSGSSIVNGTHDGPCLESTVSTYNAGGLAKVTIQLAEPIKITKIGVWAKRNVIALCDLKINGSSIFSFPDDPKPHIGSNWAEISRTGIWENVTNIQFIGSTGVRLSQKVWLDNCYVEYEPDYADTESPHDCCDCTTNWACDAGEKTESPISIKDGEKRETITDLTINSAGQALTFTRTYRQHKQADLQYMGLGWAHNHSLAIEDPSPDLSKGDIALRGHDGGLVYFNEISAGSGVYTAVASSASITIDGSNQYILDGQDKSIRVFDSTGKLLTHTFPNGEVWTYQYYASGTFTGLLQKVSDVYGRFLQFTYKQLAWANTGLGKQLWRVGDQDATGLDGGTPSGRFVEFDYIEQYDDGTALSPSADPLLSSVTDVRGKEWLYTYYGQNSGEYQTDDQADYLVEIEAPDGTILKNLTYTFDVSSNLTDITQKLGGDGIGNYLKQIDYEFDPANNQTTETIAGLATIHHFLNGNYLGTEDPQGNKGEKYVGIEGGDAEFRPFKQLDANGNQTDLEWIDGGKTLSSVTDAETNTTQFDYDSSDRLIESIDAEGRKTLYGYDADNRQPAFILVAQDGDELLIDGDMESGTGWTDVGTQTGQGQSTTQVDTGDYSWHVNGADADYGIQSAPITAVANKTYVFIARVYEVSGAVKMSVFGQDMSPEGTSNWKTIRFAHTPTTGSTQYLQFLADGAAAEFYVDSVHAVEVDTLLRGQTFHYDDKGRTIEEALIDATDGSVLEKTLRSYYTSGNGNGLLETLYQSGESVDYVYDSVGRVIKTSKSSFTGTCEHSYTLYDAAGNVLATACGKVDTTSPTDVAGMLALYDANDSTKKHTRVTTHEYDTLGRRVKTVSNAGTAWEQTALTLYDALDRVSRTVSNYVVQGSSDPDDWEWANNQWEDGASNTISHGTDNNENLISDTIYNDRGMVRMQRTALGVVTLYGYDDAGRLVKTVQNASDDGYNNNYSGTSPDPELASYVAASGVDEDIITEQAYDANGNLVKSVDAAGRVSFTVYDKLNRVTKTVRNASVPTYDIANDRLLSSYIISTEPDYDHIEETEYDGMGRVIRTRRLLENRDGEVEDVTLYGYDSLGRQAKVIRHASNPDYNISNDPSLSSYSASSNADQDSISESVYDARGRLQSSVDTDNGTSSYVVYDADGRQVLTVANYLIQGSSDPADWEWANNQWEDGASNAISHGTNNDQNVISQTVYDGDGYVESTRDVEGKVTFRVYDAAGRQTMTIANYVIQGSSDPADWEWANNQWEDGASNAISHGTNNDENIISFTEYDAQGRVVSTRDNLGRVTRPVYDDANRQRMSISNYVDNSYAAPENWIWVTDHWEDGSSTTISHGTNNDENRISETVFDAFGRVSSTRDVSGRQTVHQYDALGRRVKTIANYVDGVFSSASPDEDLISQTVYNEAGQVIETVNARSTKTAFTYDGAGRRIIVIQDAEGELESQTYTCYDKAGRTLRTIADWIDDGTDPDEQISGVWTFAPAHNGSKNDQNRIIENHYDGASRRIKVTDALGNDNNITTYNKAGQVLSIEDAEGAVTQYRYDGLKRRTLVVQNWITNNEDPALWVWDDVDGRYEKSDGTDIHNADDLDPTNVIVQVEYDEAGRTVAMRDPRGTETRYVYDKLGRRRLIIRNFVDNSYAAPENWVWVTDHWEDGSSTTISHGDGTENIIHQTTYADSYTELLDPNGVKTQRDTDAMGRLIKIDYNNSANTPEVSFEYDVAGNRTKMTENDGTDDIRITHFGYDNARRLVSVGYDSDADAIIDESVTYEYDAGGLRTKMTLPGNMELNYGYNARGQLVSISDWDGRLMRFTYDDAGRHAATLHPNGQRDKYTYNPAGHLSRIRHDRPNGSLMADFQYAVDKRGNRVSAQELMPVIGGTGNTTIGHGHSDVTYSPSNLWSDVTTYRETSKFSGKLSIPFYGEELALTVGTGPNHSMFDVYIGGSLFNTYDGYSSVAGERTINISLTYPSLSTLEIRNRPQHSLAAENDAGYQEDVYKFQFKELVVDGEYDLRTIQYTYDGLSRLLNADVYDGVNTSVTPDKTYEYAFDRAGNRRKEIIDGVTTSYSYNNLNQIKDSGFAYDANGNMTSDGTNTYVWDRANRLKSVGNTSYEYDGFGNRISQTVSSVVTDYLNDVQPGLTKVLRQSSGVDDTYYIHTPRGVLYQQNPNGDWLNLLSDGLGSTRVVVDENGGVLEGVFYDPFGNPDTSLTNTDIHFTGEFRDANGLQYHRARYYDPALGVWVSLDPLETPNRYGYVSGNVVNRVDPTGMFDWCTGRIEQGDHLLQIAREGSPEGASDTVLWETVWKIINYNQDHPHYTEMRDNPDLIQFHPTWPALRIPPEVKAYGEINTGISCNPTPPTGLPSTTPPWEFPPLLDILDGLCTGVNALIQITLEGCSSITVDETESINIVGDILYDELESVYGIRPSSYEPVLPLYASLKKLCKNDSPTGCLSVDEMFNYGGVAGAGNFTTPNGLRGAMGSGYGVPPEIITGLQMEYDLSAASKPSEDRYALASAILNIDGIENLILGNGYSDEDYINNPTNTCYIKLRIRQEIMNYRNSNQ